MGSDARNGVVDHIGHKNTLGCAPQEGKHTQMCSEADTSSDMARTIEARREILRRFMIERGLKVAQWAKEAHVNKNSIYNFLNGHSQALDAATYGKLARAAKVPVWKLSGDDPEQPSPTSVWVVGYVEAGNFQEAIEWDRSNWYPIDVPTPSRFHGRARALEVRGPSMNLEYPEGSVVLWVDVLEFREPLDGDHVIVYQHGRDDTVEATVKEFRLVDGMPWLWPRSSSPEHQQPIDPRNPDERVVRVEVRGIVFGSYRSRIR